MCVAARLRTQAHAGEVGRVLCEESVSMCLSVGVTEDLFLLRKGCWGSGLYNVCYCNYKGVYNFYMTGSEQLMTLATSL